MASDFTEAAADAIMNHMRGGTAWTQPTGLYVQLHTGDPGTAGTSNASAETERKQVTFGNASSGGQISNTAPVSWTAWDVGSETISHISIWTDPTAGTCLMVGDLTFTRQMSNGDTLTFPTDGIDLAVQITGA